MRLLLGGAILIGLGVGTYLLLAPRPAAPALPRPTPQPQPAPGGDLADSGGMYCAQVATQCADGTWAGTPCECRDRGGVAARDPRTVVA